MRELPKEVRYVWFASVSLLLVGLDGNFESLR